MATLPRRAQPHFLFVLQLALLCCLRLHRAAAQPAVAAGSEAQLLIQIKRAWGDPSVLAAWNDTDAAAAAAHCSWPYVRCDSANRVANLSLAGTNVTGALPDAIGDLASLTHLDVSNNNIVGAFPTSLYRCASLQYLNLSQNYLAGELPADIGSNLGKNLTSLILNNNEFNGTIPASLSRLRSLQWLELDNNFLAGAIPAELGDLTNLQTLILDLNKFDAGELPASFKSLTKLRTLSARKCNLVGDFPSYVADMAELETLDLAINNLTGSIPPGIWNLTKLQTLYVFANNLTGDVVVDGPFGAVNLVTIDMSANYKLSGRIPEAFGHLPNLTELNLFFSNFTGEIPESIGQLPSLMILKLFNNSLTGVLPPEMGKKSPELAYVSFDYNDFTGKIPEGLCDNGKFRSLTAKGNRLNGSIPASLASCATLTGLLLNDNELSGEVPDALWTATMLQNVYFHNNQLSGSLPAMMYFNLTTLRIENNRFGGSIPAVAAGLVQFTAGNNQFSGEIAAALGSGMPLLQSLNLSGNQLSGGIPANIAKLKELTQLDLSRNLLSSEIPAELGALPALNALDLSSNMLSGDIPPELATLKLSAFNLSSNQLRGQVPGGLAIAPYDRSFLGNPSLCTSGLGSSFLAGVRSCTAGSAAGSGASSGGVSPALRTGLLAAGAALLVVIVASAVFVVRDIKRRRRAAEGDDWKMTPFQTDLGFGEAAILRGLTEESLIGRGGSGRVYRVAYTNRYNGSAGVVAVKQIRSAAGEKVDDKLEREFESEASVLGNLRHNNIVRLLCCLSRENSSSKLLVYDYMANGSLDRWLHGEVLDTGGHPMARSRSARRCAPAALDWPARLRVAVGAAQGLCYMHHECSPPIIHRDVKTSNILLDSEFRAKVADFGLARMLAQAGTPDTMSAVAGSLGYMAPECGYTRKLNEKVDVYSFGVVLLELTTGRTANDGGEHGCLAGWARHHYQSGGGVPEATDMCVRYAGHSDEIEAVFRLGLLCTAASPSSRPTMKDVLQVLLRCSEQARQKSKAADQDGAHECDAAPLLLPKLAGSRRKSNKGRDNKEGDGDFDCIV